MKVRLTKELRTQHRLDGGLSFGHIMILLVAGDEDARLILEDDRVAENRVKKIRHVTNRQPRNGRTVHDKDDAERRGSVFIEELRPQAFMPGNVQYRQDLVFDFRDKVSLVFLHRRTGHRELLVNESEEKQRLAGIAGTHEQDGAAFLGRTTDEEEKDGEENDEKADDHAQGHHVALDYILEKVFHDRLHLIFYNSCIKAI